MILHKSLLLLCFSDDGEKLVSHNAKNKELYSLAHLHVTKKERKKSMQLTLYEDKY